MMRKYVVLNATHFLAATTIGVLGAKLDGHSGGPFFIAMICAYSTGWLLGVFRGVLLSTMDGERGAR